MGQKPELLGPRGSLSEAPDRGMTNPSSPSLVEVVKQVAEQQHTQDADIKKSKVVLSQLQAQLHDLEAQMNCTITEKKTTDRQIYQQDETIATTKVHCENLENEITALHVEKVKLMINTEALEEEFKMMLLRNSAYYEKMAAHRNHFEEAERKLPLMIELTKKRATIQEMITKKEELKFAVWNLQGNATNPVQEEIAYLESEIKELEETIDKMKNVLQEEKDLHARLQKEIEVQNKRCEAILKRLHCQVNKLQSSKRQWYWTIQQKEEKVKELRKLVGITN
ncbi:coiled-coil domain-containing protein 122 [Tiliqua scincoides]|uniref:coiled-coil domain-containing protein 122 n=1 Tax=Tiliqua scincoides TaxID=71010 RepID=UPI00346330ED